MKHTRSRPTLMILIGAPVAGLCCLGVAAVAFACVVQPVLTISPRSSGPAGSNVTVAGENFVGPVELRWNAFTGRRLAAAQGPNFLAPILIPRQRPGLYTLIALGRGPDGSVVDTARAEFLITGPGGPLVGRAGSGATTGQPRVVDRSASGSSDGSLAITAGVSGLVFLLLGGIAGATLQRRSARRRRLA